MRISIKNALGITQLSQVTEKLKKLRRELEDARQLLISVTQRERLIKERIENERKVFEQRTELKKVKVALEKEGPDTVRPSRTRKAAKSSGPKGLEF